MRPSRIPLARPVHRFGSLCALLHVSTLALLALGCQDKKAAAPPLPPPEVTLTQVVQQDVPMFVEWIGTIDGDVNAEIRARVQGYLQSRDYSEGSRVKAGDLLFRIDPRPYVAALDQATGDLGRAQAQLTKTEQDVRRYTPLAAEGAISQQELDNAIQSNRAAKAAVESAKANVEKAQLDLDWTEIRSPIDGVAGIATTNIGDLISESTVLTTVSQLDPVRVSFNIAEQEYLRFAAAGRVSQPGERPGDAPLELILADGSIHPERGRAIAANRQVDIKTGTMTILGIFPNPTQLLRPGQFAKVRATIETRRGALLVPQRSVQEVQGTHLVAVVDADNKVAMRSVSVGPRVGNLWVIDKGVQVGERVIVDGLQKVREGVTVNPKPAAAAAQG